MFEKEAKEKAKRKIYNFIVRDWGVSPIRTEQTCEIVEGIPHSYQYSLEKMWQEGAEYGYNKCKEELNHKGLALQSDMDKTIEQNIARKKELNKVKEWHYAKDELPPLNTNVLVIHKWHRTPEVGKRITVFSNSSVWVWAMCCDRYRYTGEDKNVIAWKEITLPKKE